MPLAEIGNLVYDFRKSMSRRSFAVFLAELREFM